MCIYIYIIYIYIFILIYIYVYIHIYLYAVAYCYWWGCLRPREGRCSPGSRCSREDKPSERLHYSRVLQPSFSLCQMARQCPKDLADFVLHMVRDGPSQSDQPNNPHVVHKCIALLTASMVQLRQHNTHTLIFAKVHANSSPNQIGPNRWSSSESMRAKPYGDQNRLPGSQVALPPK